MKTVGITGGAGFIGSYITRRFLNADYKVKVSVTSISSSEKYEHLFELGNEDNLSIHELDVREYEKLENFTNDCEVLVHCGTPFKLGTENPEKELFEPTISGTENFLKLISRQDNLEKMIFISSVAAYNTSFPYPVSGKAEDHLYTEEDAPYLDEANIPYAQAKYFADKKVRDFLKNNGEVNTDIHSLAPVTVIGNPLSGRKDSTSAGLQNLFRSGKASDVFTRTLFDENIEFALVDVEDVAEAVYRTLTANAKHGQNYLLSSESWRVSDISRMLNGQEPEAKARMVYSNKLAREELGMNFKPVKNSLQNFQ